MMTFSLYSKDSTTNNIPDSTKLTLATVYADAKEAMKGLGAALKVGSEHVYGVLVKQQVVKSVSDIILIVFLLAVSIFGVNYTRKTYKAHLKLCGYVEGQYNRIALDDSAKGILSVVLAIVSIVCIIVFFTTTICCYEEIVTGFINPEYGAIKEIMDLIKR